MGTHPKNGHGKLAAIKGAMIIGENYGLALDPEPCVIPFHQVQQRLEALRAASGGRPVRTLRNGMPIRISAGPRAGTWKIFSAMGNMKVKLAATEHVTWDERRPGAKKVALAALIKGDLTVLPQCCCGHAPTV